MILFLVTDIQKVDTTANPPFLVHEVYGNEDIVKTLTLTLQSNGRFKEQNNQKQK